MLGCTASSGPDSPATRVSTTMSRAVVQEVKEVYLLLSTPGGGTREGTNLYNVLKGMPFDLTIHNVGSVSSIGNAVFLAGGKRYAASSFVFMFHGVGFTISQQTRLEEKHLRERLDEVSSDQKRIGGIITENSNLTEQEVADLFLTQQTKDADWAVDKGIVDEIRDVQIPNGVPMVSLVFQRQAVGL